MRQQTTLSFLLRLAAIMSLISLTSCAQWRARWSEPETATLRSVQDDLQYARMETAAMRKLLDELVFADNADLPRAHRAFRVALNDMTGVGEKLVRHANGLRYEGDAYLVEGETSAAQCRYPRLSSNARMPAVALGDAFASIAKRSGRVERAYRAFRFDLDAIDRYLSDHLNEKGVRDMTVFIRKSAVDGESLTYALDRALTEVAKAEKAASVTVKGGEATQERTQP